jgi:DNA-binding CsgD family transcriptional regulator
MKHNDDSTHGILEGFLELLEAATTAVELRSLLEDTLRPLGYDQFAYHIIRNADHYDGAPERQIYGITNYSQNWTDHYITNKFVNYDPVIELALVEKAPFMWLDKLEVSHFSLLQKRLFNDAAGIGITNGLTIPLLSMRGERAAISLIPRKVLSSNSLTIPSRDIVQLISHFFHARALQIVTEQRLLNNSPRRRSFLSAREGETIMWVSRGKSSWEISQILGISEKSVEFYVDAVKRKLGASNRTQAVVKAMMLGLIGTDEIRRRIGKPRQHGAAHPIPSEDTRPRLSISTEKIPTR